MAQLRFFLAVRKLRADIPPAEPLQPVSPEFVSVNEKEEARKDSEHCRYLARAGLGERGKADLECKIGGEGKPKPVPREEERWQQKAEQGQSIPQEQGFADIAVGRKIGAVKSHSFLIATGARPYKAQPLPVQALSVPLVEGIASG